MRQVEVLKHGIYLTLGILLSMSLTGCGGGGSKAYYYNRNTTIGQELSDLQGALQRGAITEDEYRAQRERILNPEKP